MDLVTVPEPDVLDDAQAATYPPDLLRRVAAAVDLDPGDLAYALPAASECAWSHGVAYFDIALDGYDPTMEWVTVDEDDTVRRWSLDGRRTLIDDELVPVRTVSVDGAWSLVSTATEEL